MNLVKLAPENLEVANSYLRDGSIQAVANELGLEISAVSQILNKREVKSYIDSVYLDMGYRNRFRLGITLDKIIEAKLAETEDTQVYSNKDLADLLLMAHKMRMDEMRAMTELVKAEQGPVRNQTNVQINETPFGSGNYGKLMEKLLASEII